MDKDNFIKQLVVDWSYKVSNGRPDVTNEYHLQILQNILEKKKIPTKVVIEIMNNLRGYRDESITQTDAFCQTNRTMTTGSTYYEPNLEKNEVKSYYYDHDWEKVMECGHNTNIENVLNDKKVICPKTNEIFLETINGTLVKEQNIIIESETPDPIKK